LLDEPLAALDRKLREEMQLEFRRIQRELGVTTINVTHDQREALVVSDAVVMDGGEIQQMAQPSETYRNPSNAFVANFIGVTNFISGKASSLDGNLVRVDAGTALVGTAGEGRGGVAPDANVSCAIRAEQIRIGGSAATHAGTRYRA
jgi:putative spermidine/putrescine transport system ATP-binding protein